MTIKGNRWEHPVTGEVRYYIDPRIVAKRGGLRIYGYDPWSGEGSYARLDGERVTETVVNTILARVDKAWYTLDGKVCLKFDNRITSKYDRVWERGKAAVEDELKRGRY